MRGTWQPLATGAPDMSVVIRHAVVIESITGRRSDPLGRASLNRAVDAPRWIIRADSYQLGAALWRELDALAKRLRRPYGANPALALTDSEIVAAARRAGCGVRRGPA